MCVGTVVKVDDRRVSGDAGVKVGHERSDVLCCRQHPMDHVASVDEPCQRRRRNETLEAIFCKNLETNISIISIFYEAVCLSDQQQLSMRILVFYGNRCASLKGF